MRYYLLLLLLVLVSCASTREISECYYQDDFWDEWIGVGTVCTADADCKSYGEIHSSAVMCQPTEFVVLTNKEGEYFSCVTDKNCLERIMGDAEMFAQYANVIKCNYGFCEVTKGFNAKYHTTMDGLTFSEAPTRDERAKICYYERGDTHQTKFEQIPLNQECPKV